MHIHTDQCIVADYEDYSEAGGGEVWEYYSCIVTGETHHKLSDFAIN